MAGLLVNIPLCVRTLGAGLTGAERRALHRAEYVRILEDAKRAATDRDLDLVFVHWPIPHHPWIYDRVRGDFSLDRENTYLDNLALVDRTMAELRAAMERAGTWDETAVLVTADHSWHDSPAFNGKRDRRVPFILKLAGQSRGIEYRKPLKTVLIHDLVLAMLRGELTDPEAVADWLDRRRVPGGQW
jgi:hypothetical protein